VRDERAGERLRDGSEQEHGEDPHVRGPALLYIAGAANVIPVIRPSTVRTGGRAPRSSGRGRTGCCT
jgi:hypothetical protein